MTNHDAETILRLKELLGEVYALKEKARRGWLKCDVWTPESVAAHSWSVALLALIAAPDNLNREKCLSLALIHDLAEAFVGDITPDDRIDKDKKHRLEYEALKKWCDKNYRFEEIMRLFEEYLEQKTPESRFVHTLDKCDIAVQRCRYEKQYDSDFSEFNNFP